MDDQHQLLQTIVLDYTNSWLQVDAEEPGPCLHDLTLVVNQSSYQEQANREASQRKENWANSSARTPWPSLGHQQTANRQSNPTDQ